MMNQRQIKFEEQSHTKAIEALYKQIDKAKSKAYFSSTDAGRDTVKTLTAQLSGDLQQWLEDIAQGRAKTRADAAMAPELVRWLEYVPIQLVAVVAFKTILDTHGGGFDDPTTAKVGKFIGTRLEDELRFKFYEITAPQEVVDAAWRRVSEAGSSPHYRRMSTKIVTERLLDKLKPDAEKWSPWSSGYKCSMGLLLLEFCIKEGICEKENKRVGKKTKGYIRLTPAYLEWVDKYYSQMEDIAYFRKPLIEKPLPWEFKKGPSRFNTSGGYHTDALRNQLPMCRGAAHLTHFGELSTKFLNLLGETAYTVDTAVLEVAQHLADKNIIVGSCLPYVRMDALDERMPEELVALDTKHPDRVEWKRKKKELYQTHNELVQKSVRTHKSLEAAKEFLAFPRFHLSWSYDYRGRAYPVQPWLQPQSTEFEKSLIRFADGCHLDDRARWWVLHAIGAAYLGTRLNLQERVKWATDNMELIHAVGSEPISNISLWESAKEPFQFLQLCLEYYKVEVSQTQHLWYVPVGADATCSGLQLLSGCLRDEKGMKHSNVLKPDNEDAPPEDAYILVLNKAKELAAAKGSNDLIPFMEDRNLGKTTMVMLYGATGYTIRQRVQDVFRGKDQLGKDVSFEMCSRMAALLEEASYEVFPKAFEALKWLSQLGAIAAKKNPEHFGWKTPAGDYIKYRIYSVDTLDIRLPHLGKVRIPLDTDRELDYKDMCKALAPSFVHSLDAALLKLSFDEWKHPMTTVHDCFKVLPKDMDRALEAIRRAFYAVCDGNPLSTLADDMNVPTEDHTRLTQGTGNLQSVFDSTYLFN